MYILHYVPDNASLIVRLVLEEMGLPYETRLLDRRRGAQNAPAYRRLSPAGLIPALETSEGALFETGAILLWLAERHGRLAPAPGMPDRGDFLKWLFFTSNTAHADMRLLFYADRYSGTEGTVAAFRKKTQARIAGHFALLEGMAEGRPAWCHPDAPSVLAWYLAALIRWLALYPEDGAGWFDLAAFPALRDLAAALESRPAATRAALAEGLGSTIFTRPSYPRPPAGDAT
ncbi:MAG: glutathione S-transferase family protein [Albidovulum sp.]